MLKQFLAMFQSLCCCWKKIRKNKSIHPRYSLSKSFLNSSKKKKITFVKIFETLFFNLSQIKNVFLSCDTRFSFSNDLSYFNLRLGIGKKVLWSCFFFEKVKSNFKKKKNSFHSQKMKEYLFFYWIYLSFWHISVFFFFSSLKVQKICES